MPVHASFRQVHAFKPSGDWDSGNPAFAISRGSPGTPPRTPRQRPPVSWHAIVPGHLSDQGSAIRSKDTSSSLCPLRGLYSSAPRGAHRTAGVRASSSMSVDHAPWSSEMPSGRVWKPGSRREQPRCPRRPSAGPAPLRWDMNCPPADKSWCSAPIHAIGLSTTTARASALVPDPCRVGAACPRRVRWSRCGQPADRH